MHIIKQLLNYLFWIFVSILIAIVYTRIILGPIPKDSKGLMRVFDLIYYIGVMRLVPIIASIIALLYILMDVFYLKTKLENKSYKKSFRLLTILMITVVTGIIHYVLEKVIDII